MNKHTVNRHILLRHTVPITRLVLCSYKKLPASHMTKIPCFQLQYWLLTKRVCKIRHYYYYYCCCYRRTPLIWIESSHPEMQKIQIIGFFFLKTGDTGSLKWKKKILQMALLGYIFIFKCNSLYVFDKGGKYLSHKKMQYNYSTKMFTQRARPIQISGFLLPSEGRQFKVTALISPVTR